MFTSAWRRALVIAGLFVRGTVRSFRQFWSTAVQDSKSSSENENDNLQITFEFSQPETPTSNPGNSRSSSSENENGMFGYAASSGKYKLNGPYAVVDVETTGLTANAGRIVEIAILRTDGSGKVEDEFSTLINPDGQDTGAVNIHKIKNEDVLNAPRFSEVSHEILSRLSGSILVAHNASFEEGFLRKEFELAGFKNVLIPALCSLRLSQRIHHTKNLSNHKLGTLASAYDIPLKDAHTALGDVRALNQLLPVLLTQAKSSFYYPCLPYQHSIPPDASSPRLVTRAVGLSKGTQGWMACLLERLPQSAVEADDVVAQNYWDCLGDALTDSRITADEARALASIAGQAGLGAAQVRRLNETFLENLRIASLAEGIPTTAELKQLVRTAAALGSEGFFDDLPAQSAVGPQADSVGHTAAGVNQRRCGHCRQVGHYRKNCPTLPVAD